MRPKPLRPTPTEIALQPVGPPPCVARQPTGSTKPWSMSTPLLIDANNLIVRSIFATAMADLTAGGVFTGGIFGSLNSLRSIVASPEVRPGPIVAFFDAGVPPFRMKLLPDYKQARREKKEQLSEEDRDRAFAQIGQCYSLWPMLGVQCLAFKDREADDGVAAAARVWAARKPIVVSSDRDLWQTVNWGCSIYDLRTNQIIDADNFEEHSEGVPANRWLLYRTLVGDTSDGIVGARGCGPARAREVVARVHEDDADRQLDSLIAVLQAQETRKAWEQSIVDSADHLHRVRKAIDLRKSFGPVRPLLARLEQLPEVQTKPFLKECIRLQFNSVLGDPDGTIEPFKKAQARR